MLDVTIDTWHGVAITEVEMRSGLAHVPLATALVLGALIGLGAGGLSCGSSSSDKNAIPPPGSDSGAADTATDTSTDTQVSPDVDDEGYNIPDEFQDFPSDPIVADGLPSNIGALFEGATGTASGGPCLAEPPMDAMVPNNWSPLLFEWQPAAGQNVFELTLSVDNQTNELVVYTTATTYTMDALTWSSLTQHSSGHDVTISLRGASFDETSITSGPAVGASGSIHIAPVGAKGAVVYWDASGATSFEGFQAGDSQPVTVLTPTSAGNAPSGNPTTCISCHASASKGKLLVYTADSADGSRVLDVRMMDGTGVPSPSMATPSALALLGRHKQSAPTTTLSDSPSVQSLVVSIFIEPTLTGGRSEVIWTNLLAQDLTGWGIVARNGDTREATSPSWSHDGSTIAYVSSDGAGEGVIASGAMDICTVPFSGGAGGTATPLEGASDPVKREFYPVYSPHDTLVAFNRTDLEVDSYDEPTAEVFVVPGTGGTPQRLRANDAPACTGFVSPGLTNSWPRWAPQALEHGGKRYYWLVFSSKRHAASTDPNGAAMAQLYIAAVVTQVTSEGETYLADYPPLYVAAQKASARNHTPVWDYFEVPQVPK